jgi:hypothetical protein
MASCARNQIYGWPTDKDKACAVKLSGALRVHGFQDKYDKVTAKYVASLSIGDSKEALEKLDAEAIAAVAAELATGFKEEIINELPNYETAFQSNAKEELYRSGVDVARTVAGLVPGLGHVVHLAELALHGGKASADLAQLASVRTQEKAFVEAQRARKEKIEAAISRLNVGPAKKNRVACTRFG